jgi:hypothetical protein
LRSVKTFFYDNDSNLEWQAGPPNTGADSGQLALVVELYGPASGITHINMSEAIGDKGYSSIENSNFTTAATKYAGPQCAEWVAEQLQSAVSGGSKFDSSITCGETTLMFSSTGAPDTDATLDMSPVTTDPQVTITPITIACPTGTPHVTVSVSTVDHDPVWDATFTGVVTNDSSANVDLSTVTVDVTSAYSYTSTESLVPIQTDVTLLPGRSATVTATDVVFSGNPTLGPPSIDWTWTASSRYASCPSGEG